MSIHLISNVIMTEKSIQRQYFQIELKLLRFVRRCDSSPSSSGVEAIHVLSSVQEPRDAKKVYEFTYQLGSLGAP